MNCKKCGFLLNGNEQICPNCGEPVEMAAVNQGVNAVPSFTNNVEPPAQFQPEPQPLQQPIQQPAQPINNMNDVNLNNTQPMPNLNNGFNQQPVDTQNVNMQNVQPSIQPSVQPQVNTTNNVNQGPATTGAGSNNSFKIIIAILAVVVLGIGGFILYKTLSKDDNSGGTADNNNAGNQVVDQIDTNSDNTFVYKNFQFIIPTGYEATEEDDMVLLSSANARVAFVIHDYYTLEDIELQLEDIKKVYADGGFVIKSVDNKSYNGKNWIILPCTVTQDGQTMDLTLAYTGLGEYHVIEALIATRPNYDAVYTELSSMFDSATYNGTKSFAEGGYKEEITPTMKIDASFNKFDE